MKMRRCLSTVIALYSRRLWLWLCNLVLPNFRHVYLKIRFFVRTSSHYIFTRFWRIVLVFCALQRGVRNSISTTWGDLLHRIDTFLCIHYCGNFHFRFLNRQCGAQNDFLDTPTEYVKIQTICLDSQKEYINTHINCLGNQSLSTTCLETKTDPVNSFMDSLDGQLASIDNVVSFF